MSVEQAVLAVAGSIDEVEPIELEGTTSWNVYGIPAGSLVAVRGWGASLEHPDDVETVVLRVDDGRPVLARYGLERPDVAQALESEAFRFAGFRAVFSTLRLAPGAHVVRAYLRDRAGRLKMFAEPYAFSISNNLGAVALGEQTPDEVVIHIDRLAIDGVAAISPLMVGELSIVSIEGWAIDDSATKPARAVFAIFDGIPVRGTYGLSRPDVAESREDPQLEFCGFQIHVPADMIPSGQVRIAVRALSEDGFRSSEHPETIVITVDRGDASRDLFAARTTAGKADEIQVVGIDGHMTAFDSLPVHLRRGEGLYVRGWAIDETAMSVGSSVYARVDGIHAAYGSYFLNRPDVAEAFGLPDLASAGFVVRVRTDRLTDGPHEVQCCLVSADGRVVYDLPEAIQIVIEGD
jgi:hypothetical protein